MPRHDVIRVARRWLAVAVAAGAAMGVAGITLLADGGDSPDVLTATAPTSTSPPPSSVEVEITGPAPGPFVTANPVDERVDPACLPPVEAPASARQVVVVDAASPASSYATVDLLVRDGTAWRCALTDVAARVGRNGVRPLAQRRSGDGTTPSGVFPLAPMTAPDGQTFEFFGNGPDPGVQGSWRQVQPGDCWVASPNTAAYNTLVTRPASACASPDEYLPAITGAYSAAALIGANMGPDRSGDQAGEPPLAAAIFLHRFSYDATGASKATSGCVSLAAADLETTLRALRPGEAWFVIR